MKTIRGIPWRSWPALLSLKRRSLDRPVEVLIAVADHFEPEHANASAAEQRDRVSRWVSDYPQLASRFTDSFGNHPQHTFFVPIDERPNSRLDDLAAEHLDRVAAICRAGYGDVEIHLHHGGESSQWLRDRLENYKARFFDRGLLRRDAQGVVRYGFVHGNWALDNSHPKGVHCGINDELTILRETGCYADFTMPSAPAACQTTTINGLYYAVDDPRRPRSHDFGPQAAVDVEPPPDGLLMVQGPLSLGRRRRNGRIGLRLENGALQAGCPPHIARLTGWLRANVHVRGRPDQIFVKLHTHGAVPANADVLLGKPMSDFHTALAELARRNSNFRYRYVTAFEMACAVRPIEMEAEAGAFSTSPALGPAR